MNLLATPRRRRVLFALLYFAEGAPIGYLWWTLPVQLRQAGIATDRITALVAAIGLPWALKFLWAPLVDLLHGPRFGLRGWILTAQVLMALTLAPLFLAPAPLPTGLLLACLLGHAFAAATQDVAIDALAVKSTSEAERGVLNGWMNFGMLLGRSLFGALALRFLAEHSPRLVPSLLAAVILATAIVLVWTREDGTGAAERDAVSLGARARALLRELRQVLAHRSTWAGLGFALLAGLGFESVGIMAGPFLVDRGLTSQAIGDWRLVTVACMAAGGLIGGIASDRLGRRRAVALFTALMALAIVAVAAAGSDTAVLVALDGLYVAIGLFTAASYALFMDLTDPRLGATQFTAFMAMTNLCESIASAAGGRLQASHGYAAAFTILAAISLLSLPLLLAAKPARSPRAVATFP